MALPLSAYGGQRFEVNLSTVLPASLSSFAYSNHKDGEAKANNVLAPMLGR